MPMSVSCSTISGSASSHTVVIAAQNKSKIRIHLYFTKYGAKRRINPFGRLFCCVCSKNNQPFRISGVPGTPASHKICTFILPRLLRLYKGKSPHFRRRSAAIRSPLGMWMISSRVIAFVNTAAST